MRLTPATLETLRHVPPETPDHLWDWLTYYTGVHLAREPVCRGHDAPFRAFCVQYFDRPSLTLTLGSRGSGKSFGAALLTHLSSRFRPGYGTRILGGSKAQSEQIYSGLTEAIVDGRGILGSDADTIRSLLKESATYRNGSRVSILAASPTSVRGPHVPALRLDEVDEIDTDIRESAMGMAMDDAKRGYPTQVSMTSTWHRLGGPMGELIERARDDRTPFFTFCAFEILERCPASRSGPPVDTPDLYEHCPACPIRKWCHEEVDGRRRPKAKRSAGHYAIESLIQKVRSVSLRTFEADYLCKGPKADGLWFRDFDPAAHVTPEAEYDPALPVLLAIDSGVFTGAVWLQVRPGPAGSESVAVFADYLSEGLSAESNAAAILEVGRRHGNGRLGRIVTDPAGGARNPVGPTVIAEYERAGLRPMHRWPLRPVADGLALVESFVRSADGGVGLAIHPRCKHLIASFQNYRRAKRAGQWQDYPADPLHPWEDLMDALRGGLYAAFPEGRRPAPAFRFVPSRRFL